MADMSPPIPGVNEIFKGSKEAPKPCFEVGGNAETETVVSRSEVSDEEVVIRSPWR